MPELPEVETVRKYLDKNLKGEVINYVQLLNKKSLRNSDEINLKKIEGQRIINFDRKAKHLIMVLEKEYLIMHLRMEGKFFIFNSIDEMNKKSDRFYDVAIFETRNYVVVFQDTRRFATIDLFESSLDYEQNPILSKVANEPFNQNANNLYEKIKNKNVAIKTVILNQEIISGIGNIYADEILYDVKLHPETKAKFLTIDDVDKIIKSASKILNLAIKHNGTTIKSYTSSLGVEGSYQNFLKVHQQVNKICKRDEGVVEKIKVGGRGTYFCSKCQIKKEA